MRTLLTVEHANVEHCRTFLSKKNGKVRVDGEYISAPGIVYFKRSCRVLGDIQKYVFWSRLFHLEQTKCAGAEAPVDNDSDKQLVFDPKKKGGLRLDQTEPRHIRTKVQSVIFWTLQTNTGATEKMEEKTCRLYRRLCLWLHSKLQSQFQQRIRTLVQIGPDRDHLFFVGSKTSCFVCTLLH